LPDGAAAWCPAARAALTTQGSGWGVLAYEPVSGRLIIEQIYDHQGNVGVAFIDAMWEIVNWQDVAKRYAAAKEHGNNLLLDRLPLFTCRRHDGRLARQRVGCRGPVTGRR
jgi:hypothetical protein